MHTKDWLGIYIGRLNPIHTGHENIINNMIKDRQEQCILVLWSINEKLSWRNMFTYKERATFIQKIFPGLMIQGIPDFLNDNDMRIFTLDQIIKAQYTWDIKNVVFYGGCEEEISFLLERNRTCKIINRFDGVSSPKVSATEVRDHLHRWLELYDMTQTKKALEWYINPLIQDELIALFSEKVSSLKKI